MVTLRSALRQSLRRHRRASRSHAAAQLAQPDRARRSATIDRSGSAL